MVVAIIGFCVALYHQRNMVSGIAPDIQAPLVSGKSFNLDEARSEGPVLIYFWGSWCPVCLVVSPAVDSIAQDALSNKHNVLSIALTSGNDADITKYQNEHAYTFETLNDNDGRYSQQWGVLVTPSIFIINQQGEVTYVSTGVTSEWGMRIRLWLARMLA